MARTEAQKKAVASFKKNLAKAKAHVAGGGSKYSWSKPSSGGSSSSGSSSRGGTVYPSDFVGPIQPGDSYAKAPSNGGTVYPSDFVGPIQPGDSYAKAPSNGGSSSSSNKVSNVAKTVPNDFVGPLQPGVTRSPSQINSQQNQINPPQINNQTNQKQYYGNVSLPQQFNSQIETYNPKTGMYISSVYGQGAGGTAYIRPPTIDEKKKIDLANYKGSLAYLNKQAEKLTTPEGVKSIFDWGAEKTLQAGEGLAKGTEKILTKITPLTSESKIFTTKSPIERETAKDIISTAYLFLGFEPLMRTATYQQSQYADEIVETTYKGQKVKVTRSDFKRYFENPEVSGKVVNYNIRTSEKISRINELLKYAKTPEQKAEIIKLATESYGKDFVKEFISQEFATSIIPTAKVTTNVLEQTSEQATKTIPKEVSSIFSPKVGVELKGISAIETGASLFQPAEVGQTLWTKQEPKQSLEVKQEPKQSLEVKQEPKQSLGLLMRHKTSSRHAQETAQEAKQDTRLITIPKQITVPKFKEPPISKTSFFKPSYPIPQQVPDIVGVFGLPGLGSPKTGGGQKGTKQKTRSSFLPEYNPSLGSVLTKQKAKQVTQKQFDLLSKKKYSGLFGRSRLEIVSKKKKPKKKK